MIGSGRIRDLVRRKWIPAIVWVSVMGAALYLYQDTRKNGAIVAFASSVEHQITSARSGRIAYLSVQAGQSVRAGQAIAGLDPIDVDAQIAVQRAELERIRAAFRVKETETQRRLLDTTRGFDQAGEAAKMALVTAKAAYLVKHAELKSATAQRAHMEALLTKGMIVKQAFANLAIRHDALKQEVAATKASIALLSKHVKSTSTRRRALPVDAAKPKVAPLKKLLAAGEARLGQLLAHKVDLTLRAPVSGKVSFIQRHRGEWVSAGTPIASVVETNLNRILACIPEHQALSIRLGTIATLRPRGGSDRRSLTGRIHALAPAVSELPIKCRPKANVPAWGRQAVITLDAVKPLLPGQAFGVSLNFETGDSGEAFAAPAAPTAGKPRPMRIAPSLWARSRFEPSGLIWVPRLARYVVVSDDTGQKKGQENHAPWLFTMDATGKVDPEPLVVSGIEAFNDLESIAEGPNETLYVLASQSFSKKGKRKPARQAFVRLVPQGRGYRADAVVTLAHLLDQATADLRTTLGIHSTWALNIEAMTRYKSGLLLGLKAPVDETGHALIWHLRHPERLFATKELRPAGLELWARVKLTVQADGKRVPGGISELLVLPNGLLVLAATASAIRPARQDGALWLATKPTNGILQAQPVQVFSGLKPEGLALSPNAGRLVLTFDTDRQNPLFLELPWPRK